MFQINFHDNFSSISLVFITLSKLNSFLVFLTRLLCLSFPDGMFCLDIFWLFMLYVKLTWPTFWHLQHLAFYKHVRESTGFIYPDESFLVLSVSLLKLHIFNLSLCFFVISWFLLNFSHELALHSFFLRQIQVCPVKFVLKIAQTDVHFSQ